MLFGVKIPPMNQTSKPWRRMTLVMYAFEALAAVGLAGALGGALFNPPLWVAVLMIATGLAGFFLAFRLRDHLAGDGDMVRASHSSEVEPSSFSQERSCASARGTD